MSWKADCLRLRGVRVFCEARGDVLALADEEGVVEHREGLQRGGGDAAHGRGRAAVGAVERVHEWVGDGAEEEAIDGAAAVLRCVGIEVVVVEERRRAVGGEERGRAARDELRDGWATHREVEPPAELQRRVAHFLGVEARVVHAGEQAVVGIGGVRGGD